MKYKKIIFTINCHNDSTDTSLTKQTARDVLGAMTAAAGLEAFEDTDEGMTGYAQTDLLDTAMLKETVDNLPVPDVTVTFTIENAEDRNWNTTWEQGGFEPINVSNRCIIHDMRHTVDKTASAGMTDIVIDAEQAFGTGTHETTQMIVGRLLDTNLTGKTVLDCGCGTGILSIAAAKLGAMTVTAYDIDEWSVRNTMHNCELNSVKNVTAMLGDVTVLKTVETSFDIALANINRNILLTDMTEITAHIRKDGILIISGFYTDDADMLIGKAASLGMTPTFRDEKNKWCMIEFRKTIKED